MRRELIGIIIIIKNLYINVDRNEVGISKSMTCIGVKNNTFSLLPFVSMSFRFRGTILRFDGYA